MQPVGKITISVEVIVVNVIRFFTGIREVFDMFDHNIFWEQLLFLGIRGGTGNMLY